jgi:hypothetical protein
MMHLVCIVRDDGVFETCWTTIRGVEAMDNNYALMDLTVYGRREPGEDSPARWPPPPWRLDEGGAIRTYGDRGNGPAPRPSPGSRPTARWSRLEAGRSDDLSTIGR